MVNTRLNERDWQTKRPTRLDHRATAIKQHDSQLDRKDTQSNMGQADQAAAQQPQQQTGEADRENRKQRRVLACGQ